MSTVTEPAPLLLQGVWPIDESANLSPRDLLEQAREDFPALANRHGVTIIGPARSLTIRPGREVKSGAAFPLVVHALIPVMVRERPDESRVAMRQANVPTPPLRDAVPVREEPTPEPAEKKPEPAVASRPTPASMPRRKHRPADETARLRAAYAASPAARHDALLRAS